MDGKKCKNDTFDFTFHLMIILHCYRNDFPFFDDYPREDNAEKAKV